MSFWNRWLTSFAVWVKDETTKAENHKPMPFLKLTPDEPPPDAMSSIRPPELRVQPKEEAQTGLTPVLGASLSLTKAMREAMTTDNKLKVTSTPT